MHHFLGCITIENTSRRVCLYFQEYSGAKNLAFNEEVKKIMAEGKKIYHFGFGQV